MSKRLVRKDPESGKVISESISCELAKSCLDCPLTKCVNDYRGWRKEDKAIADSLFELVGELGMRGWSVYGICGLLRVSEQYAERAIKGKPVGRVLLRR